MFHIYVGFFFFSCVCISVSVTLCCYFICSYHFNFALQFYKRNTKHPEHKIHIKYWLINIGKWLQKKKTNESNALFSPLYKYEAYDTWAKQMYHLNWQEVERAMKKKTKEKVQLEKKHVCNYNEKPFETVRRNRNE